MTGDEANRLLDEAELLLRTAWGAMLKMGLEDRGSDIGMPHEVRMFALDFSEEGRDGPGVLQVRGTGRLAAWLKAVRAARSGGVMGAPLLATIVRIAEDDGFDRDDRLQQIVALIEHGTAPTAGVPGTQTINDRAAGAAPLEARASGDTRPADVQEGSAGEGFDSRRLDAGSTPAPVINASGVAVTSQPQQSEGSDG